MARASRMCGKIADVAILSFRANCQSRSLLRRRGASRRKEAPQVDAGPLLCAADAAARRLGTSSEEPYTPPLLSCIEYSRGFGRVFGVKNEVAWAETDLHLSDIESARRAKTKTPRAGVFGGGAET